MLGGGSLCFGSHLMFRDSRIPMRLPGMLTSVFDCPACTRGPVVSAPEAAKSSNAQFHSAGSASVRGGSSRIRQNVHSAASSAGGGVMTGSQSSAPLLG